MKKQGLLTEGKRCGEFGDFVFPVFDTYSKQSRSSGHVLHLAYQSLSYLDSISPHKTNTSGSFIHDSTTEINLEKEAEYEIKL